MRRSIVEDKDLAFEPAWKLRDLIEAKEVSPVELTELFLRRIDELNPRLNAYLTLVHEQAIEEAKSAEQAVVRGEELGPLHGVPISIKDLEATKGIRTTLGSLAFKDTLPDRDTIVVERVGKSGAIILGKTNTPEFGLSGTTENRLGDACRNPWDTTRTAGGSSGGSGAALAAGLCPLATGSDGGGSIRIPASFCGVYGIKPSQGRVPRYGGLGRTAFSQFAQPGPMARSVRDVVMLFQVLAGPDPRDPSCQQESPPNFLTALDGNVKGLRIGWSSDLGYAAVDPEVLEITSRSARVFEDLGCSVEEVDIKFEDPFTHFFNVFSSDVFAAYEHLLEEHPDKLSDITLRSFDHARNVKGADYSRALFAIQNLRKQMTELMERYDLLLTPTMAVTAFPVGERPRSIAGKKVNPFWGFLPFTFPINMTGQPAASIPCGISKDGLPVGLHIIGRFKDEVTVIKASTAFEEARPWAQKRPSAS